MITFRTDQRILFPNLFDTLSPCQRKGSSLLLAFVNRKEIDGYYSPILKTAFLDAKRSI